MTTFDDVLVGASILVVDDTVANLELLCELLRSRGHEPRPALSGEVALAAARAEPPDLVLLDVDMPGMDGYEVCAHLKADAALRDIPVIFISALFTHAEDKVKAFSLGAVDYLTKPFQAQEVFARVDAHLRLHRLQLAQEQYAHGLEDLVQTKVAELLDAQMATIYALAKLAERRDDVTGRHLDRAGAYCRLLAEQMGRDERYAPILTDFFIENLERAAPLHDIGKVGIPDAILLKPGRLSEEEFEEMKRHTTLGADTLGAVLVQYPGNSFLRMGIDIARSHHERWDGAGYPEGLEAEDIPLAARIVAVADVYDAIRSARSYKPAMPHAAACEAISAGNGTQFAPAVADAFAAQAGAFAVLWAAGSEDADSQ
jgi:putative two-component system response regulator